MDSLDEPLNKDPLAVRFSGNEVLIPVADWQHMQIIPRFILFQDQPSAAYPHMTYRRGEQWVCAYGHLRVNRQQIERLWPPRFENSQSFESLTD